tara:strand:+ start:5 stop:505 length:501 start_codon:yes stop_codon:yes gene_type:complete
METKELKKINKIKNNLIDNVKTLLISIDSNGIVPEIGYAPFVKIEGSFYIFSSDLSPHIKLLLEIKIGQFLIIEDENEAKNIWARKRLKFEGKINEIKRKNTKFDLICSEIEKIHGKTMSLIKNFSDFHLIQITPIKGILVIGFGNAFNVLGKKFDLLDRIKPGSK